MKDDFELDEVKKAEILKQIQAYEEAEKRRKEALQFPIISEIKYYEAVPKKDSWYNISKRKPKK